MELIYYPDHDKRFAHIHPSERWKYPDEIRFGFLGSPIKRNKPFKKVTSEDVRRHGVHPCLLANDVPFLKGCYDGGGWG